MRWHSFSTKGGSTNTLYKVFLGQDVTWPDMYIKLWIGQVPKKVFSVVTELTKIYFNKKKKELLLHSVRLVKNIPKPYTEYIFIACNFQITIRSVARRIQCHISVVYVAHIYIASYSTTWSLVQVCQFDLVGWFDWYQLENSAEIDLCCGEHEIQCWFFSHAEGIYVISCESYWMCKCSQPLNSI